MLVATSILSIKENLKNNIKLLDNTSTDYIHLDIMDGNFVSNKTWNSESVKDLLSDVSKPLDVHLMVDDLDSYISDFAKLNPTYITFHLEATNNINKYISLIKSYGIKAGISIKPDTKVESLGPYLNDIDLVLVMSVEPGAGGQSFLMNSLDKIKLLNELKNKNNYKYIIGVDGGINSDTILLVSDAGTDMVVSGSYITNSDNYQERIDHLKNIK